MYRRSQPALHDLSRLHRTKSPGVAALQKPDNPDWCIIDLDPDMKTPFEKVIEAAQVTRQILDAAGVTSYCKTSGSTGLHIYFPPWVQNTTYEHSKGIRPRHCRPTRP
jgi:bifunctional non-homologous end joining protein LigD